MKQPLGLSTNLWASAGHADLEKAVNGSWPAHQAMLVHF